MALPQQRVTSVAARSRDEHAAPGVPHGGVMTQVEAVVRGDEHETTSTASTASTGGETGKTETSSDTGKDVGDTGCRAGDRRRIMLGRTKVQRRAGRSVRGTTDGGNP